jgi:putative transposase
MKKDITPTAAVAPGIDAAWRDVGASFERFCLTAGIATLADLMERDAADLCGRRYGREDGRRDHRWGQAAGKLGFHGGKMPIERPRVRARSGRELAADDVRVRRAEAAARGCVAIPRRATAPNPGPGSGASRQGSRRARRGWTSASS